MGLDFAQGVEMNFESAFRAARRLGWLAVASWAVVLSGCATYQPPQLPPDQLATIGIETRSSRLRFASIDHASVSAMGLLNSFAGRDDIQILPGRRRVVVGITEVLGAGYRQGSVTLVFDAQAGRRYEVSERVEGWQRLVRVTNDAGEPVPLLSEK